MLTSRERSAPGTRGGPGNELGDGVRLHGRPDGRSGLCRHPRSRGAGGWCAPEDSSSQGQNLLRNDTSDEGASAAKVWFGKALSLARVQAPCPGNFGRRRPGAVCGAAGAGRGSSRTCLPPPCSNGLPKASTRPTCAMREIFCANSKRSEALGRRRHAQIPFRIDSSALCAARKPTFLQSSASVRTAAMEEHSCRIERVSHASP